MNQVYDITQRLCARVGSKVATEVSNLITARDWVALQSVRLDPSSYDDAEAFWADAMCVDLLRKAYIPESGVSTAGVAVDKFLETERICAFTNARVRTIRLNSGLTQEDMAFADLLDQWKEKIRVALGPLPKVLVPKFSSGATTTTKRLSSTIPDKLSGRIETYSHSTWEVDSLLRMTRWWDSAERDDTPTRTRANEYFTVPKSGLTDRSCCKEAVGNVALQLAVGAHIRERLSKSMGIDLNHGARHHKLRAQLASITGCEATIDLSSASDLWSRELVRYVLPSGWCDLLNCLRATHTSFGGKLLYLEKFSSMGNGFTFELETLLFSTLVDTVMERRGETWVQKLCYGDDLIVPVAAASDVLQALRLVGHTPNERKTFLEGPFRESCGGDFFLGVPVNTVKLDELPEEPQHWISFANNLRRVTAGGDRLRRWALVKPVWDAVLRQLPNQLRRLRGPDHLGDLVIHDRPPEGGWPEWVSAYVPVSRKVPLFGTNFTTSAILHYVINFVSPDADARTLTGDVTGYKIAKRYSRAFSDWVPGVRFVPLPHGEYDTLSELGTALSSVPG